MKNKELKSDSKKLRKEANEAHDAYMAARQDRIQAEENAELEADRSILDRKNSDPITDTIYTQAAARAWEAVRVEFHFQKKYDDLWELYQEALYSEWQAKEKGSD